MQHQGEDGWGGGVGGQSKNQIEINDKNTEISVLGTRPRNLPMDQDFHD